MAGILGPLARLDRCCRGIIVHGRVLAVNTFAGQIRPCRKIARASIVHGHYGSGDGNNVSNSRVAVGASTDSPDADAQLWASRRPPPARPTGTFSSAMREYRNHERVSETTPS